MTNTLFTRATLTLLFTLLASGCATPHRISKAEAFPAMYEEKPTAVLVLPAINQTTAADAPLLYASTINEPLSNAGFYVLPIELTERFLNKEGLSDGSMLREVPPEKFADTFGADAVLYVTLTQWDTNYAVIAGNVTVGAQFELVSCKSGQVLWQHQDTVVVDTSGNANTGGGLIGALIATAIATSVQDYIPVARQVNQRSLVNIPYGKYNRFHDTDQAALVVVKQQ